MRIAVLVKQVPRVESMGLGSNGRIQREGVELEMNAYCRRAVSKGVELARATGGTCMVFTMGPPPAEDVLREAVAWGADEGVLVCDPAFAGSDTLATSRTLAAALAVRGAFDLVLVGRNSIDADTGQVGPELAEILGVPFAGGVRELDEAQGLAPGGELDVLCELDDGWRRLRVRLPAVLSTAERLIEPCKVPPDRRAAVAPEKISRIGAADLGPGPWGELASPTKVGRVRVMEVDRKSVVLSGTAAEQVGAAVELLREWGALDEIAAPAAQRSPVPASNAHAARDADAQRHRRVCVVMEPDRARSTRELLGEAAHMASASGGTVVAFASEPADPAELSSWGADCMVRVGGAEAEEDLASALASWCEEARPWCVLLPGTLWGREVAGRVAARLGAGLTGDAVGLGVEEGRLVAWKPAFGGRLVAAITATSDLHMATVRPGIVGDRPPREADSRMPVEEVPAEHSGPEARISVLESGRDDEVEALSAATNVVAVGGSVPPEEYSALDPLLKVLGAELAASRKVTDRGWLPRARQVGITGHSIAPALYVTIGISGKFNHLVAAQGAGTIVAVNSDPDAPIFSGSDVGIVCDWHEAVPLLAAALG